MDFSFSLRSLISTISYIFTVRVCAVCVMLLQWNQLDLEGFVKSTRNSFSQHMSCGLYAGRQYTWGWICTKKDVILFLEAHWTSRIGCLWLFSAILRGLPFVFLLVGGYPCSFFFTENIHFHLIWAKRRTALVPRWSKAWGAVWVMWVVSLFVFLLYHEGHSRPRRIGK